MNGDVPVDGQAPADVAAPAVEQQAALPDAGGDVTVALTPRQLAFLALIAAVILAIVRRVFRARRTSS